MGGPTRKKTRKEEPGVSKDDGAPQSYDRNTLNSNIYLIYDTLRIIFQYLNAEDLGSAAMVCRSWLEAAKHEKWTRGPCCFIKYDNTTLDSYYNKLYNIRIKPSAGFFFISGNALRHDEELEKLSKYIDWLSDHCEAIILYSEKPDSIIMDDSEIENPSSFQEASSMMCAFLPQIPNVRIKLFEKI